MPLWKFCLRKGMVSSWGDGHVAGGEPPYGNLWEVYGDSASGEMGGE